MDEAPKDVALAWKSLRKAQAVLQRIENKFDHQTRSCAKSQAARRKLWHEKSFDGENRDAKALDVAQSNENPPAFRQGNCAAPSSAWSQTCSLRSPAVSFGPSRMTPLPLRVAMNGEGTAGTWSPAKSLYRPQRDSLGEQTDPGGYAIQKETSPFSLHHPPPSPLSAVLQGSWSNVPVPTAVLLPTYHLSSASKPDDEKLQVLWKKPPRNKLEQLKKRIQEQKRKQRAASQQEKCLNSACAKELLQKRPLKRKVCKMVSAPPAPAYRDQRERSSAWRIQRESQRQPSPKFSALERAATGKGVKLPGASEWREGQKLARKLLGPSPPLPNLQSTAEEQSTTKTFGPGRGFVAKSMMENSSREKGKEPEFKSSLVPSTKEGGCNASTKDIKEILRSLHLQSQYDDEYRHSSLPEDTVKGKAEVLQLYQGILPPSSRPQGTIPSASSGEKMQSSLMKDGTMTSSSGNCSRGKSTSPQRQKGSSSPAQTRAEKENLKHPSKRRVNVKKPHPYSPEAVQEFMSRKSAERKKKHLEEKKSLVQAMEVRNKRLQEVYRKQKEAVRKKARSGQKHKLIMATDSTQESPQCKPDQKQTSGGIPERSFLAWVDKTSHTLLSADHRGRNHLLESVQSPKKREELTSPAALESECWFLSPLKCEDLRSCSPPPLHTPLNVSLPQKDASLYSKDSSYSVSPYRSKQNRVKAIHRLSKELAEKIEMATKRLNAASWIKDSANKTETTLELFNESSSIPEPETLKDEQDRTMTIQMLLDASDPDGLCVSSGREFHGLGRMSFMSGTEGGTALDRQKEMPTPLPGGVAVSKELPWTSHSTGQRHLNSGKDLSNTLQDFPVSKSSEVDISPLHEKQATSPASPSPRLLARSLQRELTAQRNPYQCGTIWKVQHQEEIPNQASRDSHTTLDSPSLQPSAPLSCRAETEDGFEQDLGEGGPSYTAPEEKHRSNLDSLRQTSLQLVHKLKVHQLQQKQQLTVLREKAKRELQESERFLSDLLQQTSEECSGSKGSCSSVPRSDCAEQTRRGHGSEGDNRVGSNQEMDSLKLSARRTGRDQSPAYPKMAGKGNPLGGRGSRCSALQQGSLPAEHNHQILNLLPPLNLPYGETCSGHSSGVSSEGASSRSQWSEVGRHYGGSSTFCHFSLAMAEQYLRGEELRARHQAALLKLRKKALREKARAELAWLDHQKCCLENLQDSKGASVMATKQHKILMELKQEQAEIQHLQNIYRAAHQERKLLLKQQREILMMRHSTAQLQEKLHNLTGKQEVKSQSLDVLLSRTPATKDPTELKTMTLISSPKLHSSSAKSTAHSERPDPSGNRECCLQLKNKQSRKYEGFSTENKNTLVQHQRQAENASGLELSLDAQGPNASEMVAKKFCDAAGQTTDSVSVTKDCKPTVKEVEVPVPHEIQQVGGSQCLKHLDHISPEASDEELNLKALPQGLASTESSCKSDNFCLRCESAKSDSSLPEFQKVSAAWIDISESSALDSELELRNGEDTDVSIPEEFVCDNGAVIPHASKETLIEISNGKEMLPSDKHNECEVLKVDSAETSLHSQKCPGDVSDHSCTDDLFPFIPSDTANAFKAKSADSFQSDNPAKEVDKPHLDASEIYSGNKISSQDITKQGKDAVASSSGSADTYSPKICEQQKPNSTTSRVKEDSDIDSLTVYPPTGSLKHLDLATGPLRDTVSLPPDKDTANNILLACLPSRNLPISGGKSNHAQLLTDRPSKLTASLSASTPGISEEVHAETNSFDFLQRDQKNSNTEKQVIEEARSRLLSSVPSKKLLFQAENCSSKGEDVTICISDEGLPPADTLSEILSPVDEVLSYGSADLPSSSKKDLSFPSEELPPPPFGADVMKNDGSPFSMDDFPPPPEQMTLSESRQSRDEDISLNMDALPPLPDNTLPEEFPLLSGETTDAFPAQDGSHSEQSLVQDISSAKEALLEHQQKYETSSQHLEFLAVSDPISSGQASESPDFMMKQCKACLTLPRAEEDTDDPLLSFEIGDRVLVKQTKPGTLMFKGRTRFDSGHWAGVALDKAEGDHAGTYKGVKYFECAQNCGIFVRPDEISHLIAANKSGSKSTRDEDSDSFKGEGKYSDKQGIGLTEKKAEDTSSTGGSETKENQSRLHTALLSAKGQQLPHSDQCKCKKFLCQNNLTCLGTGTLKPDLTQLNQRSLAGVFPRKSKAGKHNEVSTRKLADDIASELCKKLLLDTLIAFSATAQHKYKSAFENDVMNGGKGMRQEDNQRLFVLKENSVAALSERSAKVSDVLLCDFDALGLRGCHTAAERIVSKFIDDAVKEYKKIKRKHGSKADKIFHSSSEASPTTLPLLMKILDAGIFGSSEDFDQPNCDQHVPVRQTQKRYLYNLDQWHSAPWKKTVEVPLVIPHHSSYVKKLSACAVDELWTPENICSQFRRISMPKHFECNDPSGNDLEAESKRMYNQVIFDLTCELLCAEYQVTAKTNTFPWMKANLGSQFSRHLCRTDVSDVKMFVQGEIIKIMNLERNDLEMKRKFLNMTKYGNCKRDRVDLILIQELCREESQWTRYDDDEFTVKMRMAEDIFDSLILDTIRVLNMIYLRKSL
ncbi:coiled-coil domain-containing protein 187 isoform X3 [Melanerpes formicivorus]|uniref:coiled-coil domain-containing protein 187 isoform X3 n=1 Tax=Melanerpes formicivorus TaxID=211600 RepID=UPI00358F8C22